MQFLIIILYKQRPVYFDLSPLVKFVLNRYHQLRTKWKCANIEKRNKFLSIRFFGLLSSFLLLFPQRFGRYVLRPSSGVCRTREPSRNFGLRPLLKPWGSPVLIPFAITGYKCQVFLYRVCLPYVTVCLPYVKGLAERIKKICSPYDIRTVFTSGSTLRRYLFRVKPPTEFNMTKNCVYSIPCSCGKIYKGETGRPLKVRLEEHRKAIV